MKNELRPEQLLEQRVQNWQEYVANALNNPCITMPIPIPAKHWRCKDTEDVPSDYHEHVSFGDELLTHGCPVDEKPVCDVGDSVLFNALLGWSGEELGRNSVKASQDEHGRWWRSPLHGLHAGDISSFSKDHALGVLLYFVTTPEKDVARAQAKRWLAYMQSNGRLLDKLRIGYDIPEPLGYKIAKSLYECKDGIAADGCIVNESIEVVEDVWKKVKNGIDCISDFEACWEKTRERVIRNVNREIGYWTHNVCPEPDAGHCTITPGLWFLFHRVWRDHLGLEPSASMRFADALFLHSDNIYDQFVALGVQNITDESKHFQVHLAAVNGLVRALLGKPASQTITEVYRKRPDNPFYQFLMHKFVNPHLHSREEIRDHLLVIAPHSIEVIKEEVADPSYASGKRVKVKVTGMIGDESLEIDGDQWAWERFDVRESVRDTMGWDCIFIANLLVQEFQVDLDYYKEHVLPDLLRDRKRVLNASLIRLTASFDIVQRVEVGLDDFVAQALTLIELPDVTFDELEGLNALIQQRYREACPISLGQLYEDHRASRYAYESLLRLKEESRRKFQDAARLPEFRELWEQQMASYAETEELLQEVERLLDGKTACLKLIQLLAAIPLRIEQEKINGTNEALRQVADGIVAVLKQTAKEMEYDRIKSELNDQAAQLADPMGDNRRRLRYANATQLAEEISDFFEKHYEQLANEASLLTQEDLAEIRQDAIQTVEREKQEWMEFVTELGVEQIVLGRLNVLNNRAERQYTAILAYPESHRRALYFLWRLRSEEVGYRATKECVDAGENAFRQLSCWQFKAPDTHIPDDEWVLFDFELNGIEKLIADFATIGAPSDIELIDHLELSPLPATGVFFDAEASGICAERINTRRGVRLTACQIPLKKSFQAAPVSPSGGNRVIESLTFLNRLVILANGESLRPSSIAWSINGSINDLPLRVGGQDNGDVPVPYTGAVLELTANEINEWESNYFWPGTKIEVQTNYVYPDVNSIRMYASTLGKFTKFLARVHRDLAPSSSQVEVITSLDEGIELLGLLGERSDLTVIERVQIESAMRRMREGKDSITHACNQGGTELCSAQIRQVRDSLSTHIEEATRDLTTLRQFLQGEIQRLTAISNDMARELQLILDDLAQPERIVGIEPFLIWVPRKGSLFLSEEVDIFSGEQVTYQETNDDLFRLNLEKDLPMVKRTKSDREGHLPYNFFYWTAQQRSHRTTFEALGTAIYEGIFPDGGTPGPIFSNNDVPNIHYRGIELTVSRLMASKVHWERNRNLDKDLIIRVTVKYRAIPCNGSTRTFGIEYHDKYVVRHELIIQGSRPGRWPHWQTSAFKIVEHAGYAWREDEFSFEAEVNTGQGGPIVAEFNIVAGAVHFQELSWQILNPD